MIKTHCGKKLRYLYSAPEIGKTTHFWKCDKCMKMFSQSYPVKMIPIVRTEKGGTFRSKLAVMRDWVKEVFRNYVIRG